MYVKYDKDMCGFVCTRVYARQSVSQVIQFCVHAEDGLFGNRNSNNGQLTMNHTI